ncbi:MAG: biopolymer transporter ExbD [Bacteroidetes bacterium]|nr:biopolymer transporter ExbD [Bacteroidota bacterium]
MPKVKAKRKSTWVDMTAMCDMAFLLLTFFMLTSNFTVKEPIQVDTPSSISEIKIPETNIMKVIVDKDGKVFFGIDGQEKRISLLEKIGEAYKINFTQKEKHEFSLVTSFGQPLEKMKAYLALTPEQRDLKENAVGIPTDSLNNQFKDWVRAARAVNREIKIAIKADQKTPYPKIKNVMNTLQDLNECRFNLITSLEEVPKNL